jgi:hypothetical protein
MSLQDRTYGVEFSVLERKLIFNPKYENVGYVEHIRSNNKYFYLNPSPYKSIGNVIFFVESGDRPEQGSWVEVKVTSEERIFDRSNDRYVTFKAISGWKPFDPYPLLEHGRLTDPWQFKHFFEYPFKGDKDSIEQLSECCSLYALSSPPIAHTTGGVDTAVLGRKYLWDHFRNTMKVLPPEFFKASSRYYYLIADSEERILKSNSEETSQAIYYPTETAVHIPIVIENVSLKMRAREFQEYVAEERKLMIPYIMESLFLKPDVENVREKIIDAIDDMKAHFEKKGRAPYIQNLGGAATTLSASTARLYSHKRVQSQDIDNTVDLWKEAYNRAVYIFGSPLSPEKRNRYTDDASQLYDELYGAFGLDSWVPIRECLKVTKVDPIDFELALDSLEISGSLVRVNSNIMILKKTKK